MHYTPQPAPIMAAQAHLLPVCVIRRRRRYDPPRSNPIDTDPCAALRDEELQREFNLGLDNLGLDKLRRELPSPSPSRTRHPRPADRENPGAPSAG